jgi:hypothetical protein
MKRVFFVYLLVAGSAWSQSELNVTRSALPADPNDPGFRCGFSLVGSPQEIVLFADEADSRSRRALITIDGVPKFLRPTGVKINHQSRREITVGDTEEWDFAAGDVKLHVLVTVTSACPPDVESCEVTEYSAEIQVESGAAYTLIQAEGSCGS